MSERLPMSVNKEATSSQIPITPACYRCRSKKAKCDRTESGCLQCTNTGFDCKIGGEFTPLASRLNYTECLERRVPMLEREVQELKDLIAGEDEKIDVLSKAHSNLQSSSSSTAIMQLGESREESPPAGDVFTVPASPLLLGSENSDLYFMGASSGIVFFGEYYCILSSRVTAKLIVKIL